jgi:anti-sigma regulatory factor (Ser/Thr protein kinase)
VARQWVRERVPRGAVEVALLISSELVSNTLRHTASGLPGGRVVVALQVYPGWTRIAVRDDGPRPGAPAPWPTVALPDFLAEGGRGMWAVATLSRRWGVLGVLGGPLTVWATIAHHPDGRS